MSLPSMPRKSQTRLPNTLRGCQPLSSRSDLSAKETGKCAMSHEGLGVVRRWVGDSHCWLTAFLESVPRSIVAAVVMGSAVRERGHRRSDFDLLMLVRG